MCEGCLPLALSSISFYARGMILYFLPLTFILSPEGRGNGEGGVSLYARGLFFPFYVRGHDLSLFLPIPLFQRGARRAGCSFPSFLKRG